MPWRQVRILALGRMSAQRGSVQGASPRGRPEPDCSPVACRKCSPSGSPPCASIRTRHQPLPCCCYPVQSGLELLSLASSNVPLALQRRLWSSLALAYNPPLTQFSSNRLSSSFHRVGPFLRYQGPQFLFLLILRGNGYDPDVDTQISENEWTFLSSVGLERKSKPNVPFYVSRCPTVNSIRRDRRRNCTRSAHLHGRRGAVLHEAQQRDPSQ